MVHYAPKKTCNNTSIINHLGKKMFITNIYLKQRKEIILELKSTNIILIKKRQIKMADDFYPYREFNTTLLIKNQLCIK